VRRKLPLRSRLGLRLRLARQRLLPRAAKRVGVVLVRLLARLVANAVLARLGRKPRLRIAVVVLRTTHCVARSGVRRKLPLRSRLGLRLRLARQRLLPRAAKRVEVVLVRAHTGLISNAILARIGRMPASLLACMLGASRSSVARGEMRGKITCWPWVIVLCQSSMRPCNVLRPLELSTRVVQVSSSGGSILNATWTRLRGIPKVVSSWLLVLSLVRECLRASLLRCASSKILLWRVVLGARIILPRFRGPPGPRP